jgi:hypothetical protein
MLLPKNVPSSVINGSFSKLEPIVVSNEDLLRVIVQFFATDSMPFK